VFAASFIFAALIKAEWVLRLPSKSMDFQMDSRWKRVASQALTRREERSQSTRVSCVATITAAVEVSWALMVIRLSRK